jgi:hypothetical protein
MTKAQRTRLLKRQRERDRKGTRALRILRELGIPLAEI